MESRRWGVDETRTMYDEMFADLVLLNGKIITVDGEFSLAQAVAIKRDKIVAVGKDREAEPFIGPLTRVVDLQGKCVLPGINDSHLHVAFWGVNEPPIALNVRYPAAGSIKDIVGLVAERVAKSAPGEWIRGAGMDEGFLEECLRDKNKHPLRWDLDVVSPDNPVLIADFSGHGILANSKALALAGINRDTPQPTGGIVVKDPVSGEPTGQLREAPAMNLLMKAAPPFARSEMREAILSRLAELAKLGITSITDAALGPGGSDHQGGVMGSECISIFNDLYNEGRLSARVNILYLFGEYGTCSAKNLEDIVPKIGIHSWFGNEWLRIGGIKIFADGVPTAKTAWMHEEYVGGETGSLVLPGSTDEERYDELIKMILFAHKNGFQVGVHVTGDRGVEACIDGFAKAEKEEPRGLRHYLIHGDFITDSDLRRAARYGIGFCAQPSIKWTIADFMIGMVGEKRAAWQWPLKTLIDAGVHVTGSSDAPVTYPSWQMGIQSAVLRESKATGRVSGPEQCITREEAIRMFTIEGAWQDHMEALKGSIEVGKLADLCILDKDIVTVDALSIKDIRNLATIVGGQVVYDAGLSMSGSTSRGTEKSTNATHKS
jgi:hypothetical protein